jgi:hypothetical protein
MHPKGANLSPLAISVALLGIASSSCAGLMSETPATVIAVQPEGEWACYPAALYNSLANGSFETRRLIAGLPGDTDSERVQFLIAEHGSVPSISYAGTRSRYAVDSGITSEDAVEFLGDVLAESTGPPVSGRYLERTEGERQNDHLSRVHEMLNSSLERDFLPVLAFRSFAAKASPQSEAKSWHGLSGHAVALLQVQKFLEPTDSGFWIRFADSITGQVEQAFVYSERNQNFTATRGFTLAQDGALEWNWISDFPYLLVEAPGLSVLTEREPWNVRTIVTLQHAILRSSRAGSGTAKTP